MTSTPVPAALYARISEDDFNTEAGIRRQLEDARALAESRGWVIVDTYSDNDTSAYSGARRSGYQRLMADAEVGTFARIVVYHTSRLWRSRTERAEAIGKLAEARVSVVAVKGPDPDLSTAYGRGMAGLLGEFDTMESEVKGERVARAALQRAQEGRASGQVAYGWRRERERDREGRVLTWQDVVDPDQAAIVREIIDRLLGGESLRGVAADLNARGVPTPKAAGEWRNSTVRKLALRPANIAERVHHGQVIGPASWPAIVDRAKHDRVVALLSAPERRKSRDGSRRHLLSFGIGECGVCGSRLRHAVKRRSGRAYSLYVCDEQGCVGRSDERVDELVGAVVVERLSRPDAADVFAPRQEEGSAADDAEALRARLDTAADQFAEGLIDGPQLARITSRLRPQLEDAEQRAARARAASVGGVLDPLLRGDVSDVWEAMSVLKRRAVLTALGMRVRILPTRKGPGFVPEDVQITWLDVESAEAFK